MPRHDPRTISIHGAREHNLRDVSLELPKGRLICFTGVSGSGKSSLAFDTLFAEGQRRYIESLSAYARQFIGQLPKPNVDHIHSLAPSISIQQKSTGWNPRSTVGTITQIHDYLRVLYARAGQQHCPECGQAIATQTREHMLARILKLPAGTRFLLLAPLVRGQKGEFRDLFADLLHQGFVRARIDGEVFDLNQAPALDRYRKHDIEVVVDRLVIRAGLRPRLAEALELALTTGSGAALVAPLAPADDAEGADEPPRKRRKAPRTARAAGEFLLSASFACTRCELSFEPPAPQMFSFNSPQGMCTTCDGLGELVDFDPELLIPDPELPFLAPAVAALRRPPGRWQRHLYKGVADHLGFDLDLPWKRLPAKARQALLYGTGDQHITFEWRGRHGVWKHGDTFAGVIAQLRDKHRKTSSKMVRAFYEQFMRQAPCPDCRGARLNRQALGVRLASRAEGLSDALNIHEVCDLSIGAALRFFGALAVDGIAAEIAREPLKEIQARLRFLVDVGLDYLTLARSAPSLSGGESQRIRLASQIGAGLVGVLYVLDEPSIGLHPRDNQRLLDSLHRLRDLGNTVVVVEHDRDTMEAADLVVDFGPGPGTRGGHVVAAGSVAEVAADEASVTGAYLAGRREIEIPRQRRPVTSPPPE